MIAQMACMRIACRIAHVSNMTPHVFANEQPVSTPLALNVLLLQNFSWCRVTSLGSKILFSQSFRGILFREKARDTRTPKQKARHKNPPKHELELFIFQRIADSSQYLSIITFTMMMMKAASFHALLLLIVTPTSSLAFQIPKLHAATASTSSSWNAPCVDIGVGASKTPAGASATPTSTTTALFATCRRRISSKAGGVSSSIKHKKSSLSTSSSSRTRQELSSTSIAEYGYGYGYSNETSFQDFIQVKQPRWTVTTPNERQHVPTKREIQQMKKEQKKIKEQAMIKEAVLTRTKEEKVMEDTTDSYTLFVGNLRYDITEKEVLHLFSRYGSVESVSIPQNNKSGDKENHSRGFAFVTMKTPECQQAAIDHLHGCQLNGRRIRVSKAASKSQKELLNNLKLTKIYVGNILPTTTEQELSKVFAKYGDVKDVIIPKDEDINGDEPTNRGYGFVMMSAKDSEVAIDALNGYEMYTNDSEEAIEALSEYETPGGSSSEQQYLPLVVKKASKKPRITFWVGGLSYWTPVSEIQSIFEQFGSNVECRSPGNYEFCRGSVLVTMDKSDAYYAMRQVHGTVVDNHVVRVDKYIPPNQRLNNSCSRIGKGTSTCRSNGSDNKDGNANDKKFNFMPKPFQFWGKYLKTSLYKNMHHEPQQ